MADQPDRVKANRPGALAAGNAAVFKRVGVLYHPYKPHSHKLAQEVAGALPALGTEAWIRESHDDEAIRAEIDDLDLLIVLGGDGSTLRAARMAAGRGIPLLGINMGRIGFLSEMTPENWQTRLPQVFEGKFWLEERLMLVTESWRGEERLGQHVALNDVVVSRGSLARVVRLETDVDGYPLTTYSADGLIVSTPTGSTAYALAVGGPILPPELRNIVVVPIAAHLSLDRAIVLAEGSSVTIRISTDHQAILTVDGQFEFELQDGDRVEVRASENLSQFVRLGQRSDFYRTLLARLEPKSPDEE